MCRMHRAIVVVFRVPLILSIRVSPAAAFRRVRPGGAVPSAVVGPSRPAGRLPRYGPGARSVPPLAMC